MMILLTLLLFAYLTPGISGSALWSWSYDTSGKNLHDVLQHDFDYTMGCHLPGEFGLEHSAGLEDDPSHPGRKVLMVFYRKGTYTSHDPHFSSNNTCHCRDPCQRGAQFYIEPKALHGHHYTTMTLEYDVYFNQSFSGHWALGGKLPGLWGGIKRNCSGKRFSDDCFTARLMWRPDGDGEVYAYVTKNQQDGWNTWCNKNRSSVSVYCLCHGSVCTGVEIGKGAFKFRTRHWHHIIQRVSMGTAGHNNGYIKLWVDPEDHNNRAQIQITDIVMRQKSNLYINGIFFSTFFGVTSLDAACQHDTTTLYRNFKLYTESPPGVIG